MTKTFSNLSNARRFAKTKAGEFSFIQQADGRFEVVAVITEGLRSADTFEVVLPIEPVVVAKPKRTSKLAVPAKVAEIVRKRGGPKIKFSSIEKPCAVVRNFVKKHPKMDRAAALAKLVAMGVDRTTASIQFHKAHKGA
jgi:hypothetical protein